MYTTKVKKFLLNNLFVFIFFLSFCGMVGSLYFSEIKHFIPCVLCWYQRIALYPIVLISIIAYLHNDKKAIWYMLPLSVIGFGISVYQNLLVYNVIPEAIAPCQNGVSCTTKYIDILGFISIPLLSGLTFLAIIICLFLYMRLCKKKDIE